MADHFLTKSRISLDTCLRIGDGLVLERYSALREILLAHLGPDGAALFAEPLISRGNDKAAPSISWYTDLDGDGVPASRLDEAERAALAATLSRMLREIRALIDDPDDGPLVAAALNVLGPGDIWSARGQPVIINWGMLPEGMSRDRAARADHYKATLGRYLPLDGAPPLTDAERRARADRRPGPTAVPIAAAAALAATEGAPFSGQPPAGTSGSGAMPGGDGGGGGAPPPDSAPHSPPPDGRTPLIAWLPLLILLLLTGGALFWLLIPGNRIFPPAPAAAIDTRAAVELAEGVNRALEERVASLRGALDGAQCRADGTLLMPDGATIEGMAPPDPGNPADAPGAAARASATPMLPPDPARVIAPAGPGGADQSLLGHIEARTALVIANKTDGSSVGTGFFVGPDMLVTNFHVVASATPGEVFVTNPGLGQVYPAEIIKTLGPMETAGSDLALLKVSGASAPVFDIYAGSESLKLQGVIAAGYPGDLLDGDAAFQALVAGNTEAVPELVVTDGMVNAERRVSEQSEVVVHSAPISTGNSGGPLVDLCGRIIGINTFVQQGPLRNLSFALSSADVLAFLGDTGVVPRTVSQPCAPEVRRPEAPPAAAEAAPAPAQ